MSRAAGRRRSLARLGRVVAGHGTDRRVQVWVLAVATFAVVLTSVGAVATLGSYDGRARRDAARTPVATSAERATVWQQHQTEQMDDRYVDVLTVVPLVDGAPLPPGLPRWPAPGEVVVSPAVADAPAGRALAARLGDLAPDRIGAAGLGDPRERLVYVRPADGTPVAWSEGVFGERFGVPHGVDEGVIGSALRAQPVWVFLATYLVLVGVPSLVLLVLAARTGAAGRDRRVATLQVMGARYRDRALVVLASTWRPVVVGAVAAGCVIAPALLRDVPVPGTAYVLSSEDLRRYLPMLVVAGAGAVVLVVLTVLLLNDRALAPGTRPSPLARPVSPWVMVVAPCVIAISGWAYEQATPMGPNATTLVYYGGTLCAVLAVPLFVAGALQLVARVVHRAGRRLGSAAALAAGRQLRSEPRALLRLAAALSVVIVLTLQVQVWSTKLSAQMIDAQRLDERVGSTVVTIDARGDADDVLSVLTAASRFGDLVVVAGTADPDVVPEVVGTCPVLADLGLSCDADGPQALTPDVATGLRALGDLIGARAVVARVADPTTSLVTPPDAAGWTTTLLARPDGADLAVDEVAGALAPLAVPAPRVESLATSWLVAADDVRVKARWVTVFGTWAVAAAVVALAAAAAAELARVAMSSASWSALGAPRRTYAALGAGRILLPMITSTVVGFGAGIWLALPLLAPGEGGHLRVGTVTTGVLTVVAVSAVSWLACVQQLLRDAARWRPGSS